MVIIMPGVVEALEKENFELREELAELKVRFQKINSELIRSRVTRCNLNTEIARLRAL
jgi:septal ring factor EnvC (AmiA/AmiB activator)